MREGFYVDDPSGKRIGFGKGLLAHIDSDTTHSPEDAENRKRRLIYAVSTVTHPDKKEVNHRNIPGRTAYAKAFVDFGILAITEPESDTKGGKGHNGLRHPLGCTPPYILPQPSDERNP